MASSTTDDFRSTRQRRRRVRVVGKISSLLEMGRSEVAVSSSRTSDQCWISVVKSGEESSSGSADIVFKDQNAVPTTSRKESYKLDWCYEQDEDVIKIFSEEVKPLIQGILHGQDASVVAFGARGSGKTLLIEGSKEKPGLAPLAMSEVLDLCYKTTSVIKMSCYGIQQERVFDLLEDGQKEVHVLEDAHGVIQLKGLSQVPLKSMVDFDKFYFYERKQYNLTKKENFDMTPMTRGTIIYVYPSTQNDSGINVPGRINFVDLAGYVDIKEKSEAMSNISEAAAARRNMPLYVLQNVISALNANGIHVPYRESKVTHLLKDFVNKEKSQTLIITCLVPTHCQGTIQALKMASRSISITKRPQNHLSNNIKNIDRPSPMYSASSRKQHMLSSSVLKCEASRLYSRKKPNGTLSGSTARKLFTTKAPLKYSQVQPVSCVPTEVEQPPEINNEFMSSCTTKAEREALDQENSLGFNASETNTTNAPTEANASEEDLTLAKAAEVTVDGNIENLENTSNICKSSPPLSVQLRAITNSLKLLSTQPLRTTPSVIASSIDQTSLDLPEPKTPGVPFNLKVKDNWDTEISGTPHDIFKSRSVEVKKTITEGLLTFLNTANKQELKELKGIGEKRATYIIELRKGTSQPFTDVNDLKGIGLSSKQVEEMVRNVMGEFYT